MTLSCWWMLHFLRNWLELIRLSTFYSSRGGAVSTILSSSRVLNSLDSNLFSSFLLTGSSWQIFISLSSYTNCCLSFYSSLTWSSWSCVIWFFNFLTLRTIFPPNLFSEAASSISISELFRAFNFLTWWFTILILLVVCFVF